MTKKFITSILLLILIINTSFAYKMEVDKTPQTPVHQQISKEAETVSNLPYEMKQKTQH